MNLEAALRSIPFFRSLSACEIQELLKLAQPVEIEKKARIFCEGEVANHLYLIERGRVEISRDDPHFGRQTFALLGPGDHFGALSLFYPEPHFSSAIAREPSRLVVIRQQEVQALLDLNPSLAWTITRGLVVSLRAANQEIRKITSRFNRNFRAALKLPPSRRFAGSPPPPPARPVR